jgi:hypothetical protein
MEPPEESLAQVTAPAPCWGTEEVVPACLALWDGQEGARGLAPEIG